MIHPDVHPDSVTPAAEKPTVSMGVESLTAARGQARFDLERYRAETERLKVFVEFLSRPVHAHGGSEPDPDIITAYNLAVESALQGIRRAATEG